MAGESLPGFDRGEACPAITCVVILMNYLYELVRKLAENDVKFIIAGGVAVVLHGVERVTMDLDIAIQLESDNVGRFIEVMKGYHMTPRVPVPAEVLLDRDALRMIVEEKHAVVFTFIDVDMPLKQVDVFLRDELSYETLIPATISVNLAGYKIRVLTREKLIELKKHVTPVRDKDVLDIKALQELA